MKRVVVFAEKKVVTLFLSLSSSEGISEHFAKTSHKVLHEREPPLQNSNKLHAELVAKLAIEFLEGWNSFTHIFCLERFPKMLTHSLRRQQCFRKYR